MKKTLYLFFIALLNLVQVHAQITATINHPSGCGSEDGSICLEIKGEGPFEIDWSMQVPDDVVNTSTPTSGYVQQPVEEWNNQMCIKGLKAGKYCVTVRNASCCQAEYCFELKEGGESQIAVSYKKNVNYFESFPNPNCQGKPVPGPNDGEIKIHVNNSDPYTFEWYRNVVRYGTRKIHAFNLKC